MKKLTKIFTYLSLAACLGWLTGCTEDDEVGLPSVSNFQVFEIIEDEEGNITYDGPLTSSSVGTNLRFEIQTNADLASIWIGEYEWVPYGSNDSLPDSRNYMHYGMEGARGFEMALKETGDGFFFEGTYRFESPSDGWPVTIVTTNHAYDNANYKQSIHEVGTFMVNP